MSIKPVTYQGLKNFKANLYALEVRSRFIDQNAANGYYKGYGDELSAIVSSNIITIGSGALLVQGRLNEIETGGEPVEVTIQNGLVGYVVARIETYHPGDYENCILLAKTGASFDEITLTKEDTYQRSSDGQNKIYELPLYSFSMENGAITNLTKLISPVEENTRTRDIANEALGKINEAIELINTMLEQSYVESAGHAQTSDAATSLAGGFKGITLSNDFFNLGTIQTGTYIFLIGWPDDVHTYDTVVIGIQSELHYARSTESTNGYCVVYNGGTDKKMFASKDSTMITPSKVYYRKIF